MTPRPSIWIDARTPKLYLHLHGQGLKGYFVPPFLSPLAQALAGRGGPQSVGRPARARPGCGVSGPCSPRVWTGALSPSVWSALAPLASPRKASSPVVLKAEVRGDSAGIP